MGFCCASIEDNCNAILKQLDQPQPFQTVGQKLKKEFFDKLAEYIHQMYPYYQNRKPNMPNKIATNLNSKPIPTRQSKEIRARQNSTNSQKSKNYERASGWRQSYNSQMTQIEQPMINTYSFPRQVMEVQENEKKMMIELKEMKYLIQQNGQPFIQMKKINQTRILQQDKIINQKEQENLKIKQMINQLQMQKQTLTQLKIQNILMKQQINLIKQSNQAMVNSIQSLRINKQSQSKKLSELQIQNERLNQSNTVLLENINTLKTQNSLLLLKIREVKQKFSDQNRKELQTTKSSYIKENDYQTILKYFGNSNLLPNYEDPKTATKLRNQIIKLFSKSIQSTKLIYSYQPLSQLHFNRYIQKKENLFVLIELQNQIYVGGFAGEVDQNQEIQDTFLFSLNKKRQPVHLISKDNIKRIDFESGFINFGNGQIKIKARSTCFSCNVSGLFIKYFDGEKRVSIQQFLGDQERSRNVKGYQIYEVFFQNDR